MAAPMWRMNGVWKRMAGVVLLCTLLLCNDVMCQDDAEANITDAPATAGSVVPTDAPTMAMSLDVTTAPAAGSTVAIDRTLVGSTEVSLVASKIPNVDASGMTAAPSVEETVPATAETNSFSVSCVEPDEVTKTLHILVEVTTADCEETKQIIEDHPFVWCKERSCDLKLYQNGKILHAGSEEVEVVTLKKAFYDGPLKDKLTRSGSSSDSSVFVGVLVSGLLAAVALTVGYCKCQRRSEPKGLRLAEEPYQVDQENQGNTLVSVAPLNPPPETPEKPSVNGESPEAVKTEPTPPTNGHSTTNTADTEM
ncbi:uncharacterized protein cd34 isoform X1 [Takifugu flavidus]|uniref:uncharacterized protein cd34 isoform X1 n=1 Tax=Takifugu flavidus TaxID=433684 RepID=UPI0025447997|nr:uncharacterized protein cd34 isoform X1 [Takifugu flavidus]